MDQTQEIQQIQKNMFIEFKRICNKYKLTYFAVGGTCIGAVRHKGFIPWDDDIDIAMPYQDYKKFQLVAQQELGDGYSTFIPENHQYWRGAFMKLHNTNTAFIEYDYEDCYYGVYIDIMPIYGMPRGKLSQYFASVACDLLLFLNNRHRQPLCEQKTKVQKVIWFLDIPIRKLKTFNYYIGVIEKIFGKYALNHSDKILFGWRKRPGRFHKNYTYQNVFYSDDFKEMLECPFEDTSISIPCGYDRYLTMDFGNYMEPPPEEKKALRHAAKVIDLNRSYKDYIKDGVPK